ncbi:transcription factor MYC2-like [Hibiscus syriacus]|uniref:transcription factor MYC2-like n=1 Tax=Hibiscus syriacus TaxID=106335 RepID=UPI00192260CF|nr:transcription factor MYC2-like [Hibiscus syriacus]
MEQNIVSTDHLEAKDKTLDQFTLDISFYRLSAMEELIISPSSSSLLVSFSNKTPPLTLQQRLQRQASNDDQGRLFLAWGDDHFQDTKDTSLKLRANKISDIQGLQDERRKVMEGIQDLVGDNHDINMSMIDGTNISDAEWFYMLSLTRSFSAGEGIPGKSLTTGSLVWLTDARELQFYNCERAKETQLNGIETMVCIPISCSVLELGSSEIIKENWGLVQQVKFLFESDLNGMLQKQSTPNFSNTCSPPAFSLS